MRRFRVLLLVLLLALAGCGGTQGSHAKASTKGAVTASGPPDAQTATVIAGSDLKFAPETVRAKVGKLALTMTIQGGVPHNLTFDDSTLGPPVPTIPSGSSTQTYTFTKAGTYRFVCTIHTGMVGQVIIS
jgi:plastocyanin